jgi:NAD-dependent DNA ligase
MNEKVQMRVSMYVYCPGCGSILYRNHEQNILRCEISSCPNFQIRWKTPTVELERAEEEKIDG